VIGVASRETITNFLLERRIQEPKQPYLLEISGSLTVQMLGLGDLMPVFARSESVNNGL